MVIPLNFCAMEGCWRFTPSNTTEGIVLARLAQALPFTPSGGLSATPNPALVEPAIATAAAKPAPGCSDVSCGKMAGNITPY